MCKLYYLLLLVTVTFAAKLPGYKTGYGYHTLDTHTRDFQAQNEMDFDEITCSLDESIIEGIPITFTNGSCHNLEEPFVGISLMPHDRLLEPAYIDGRGMPDGLNRANSREVSNRVSQITEELPPNIKMASRLLIFFGQFMDHDFALILEQPEPEEEEDEEPEPLEFASELIEVEIPEGDEGFEEAMEFGRSQFCLDENFVRQFQGELTPWLDLNTVYGDVQELSDLLREGEGGRLLTFQGPDDQDFPLFNETTQTFVCGDIRCEENTMLFAFHSLFLRNHNFYADLYALESESDDDEEIYQNARIRNIAEYQFIVWEQYLPYLLGRQTFFDLTGEFLLDEDLDPINSLVFTTAVFRYGHSGVSNDLVFLNEDLSTARGTVALAESFLNSDPALDGPDRVGQLFIGQASIAHDPLDSRIVDGIRDLLFANVPVFAPGFDLVARNIERGRDHGIQTINAYRQRFGLDPYTCPNDPMDCFNDLTSDTEIAEALFELYGDISECEMWPCGMAEDNFRDSLLGETFTVIMAEQFNRVRNADRIWYDNIRGILEDAEYAPLNFPVTLVDVLERNTDLDAPMQNLFMLETVWEAFSSETEFQVEWFLPPSLRDDVQEFIVMVNGEEAATVSPTELLAFRAEDVTPGSGFDVEIMAVLPEGAMESLGMVSLNTEGASLDGGEIAGIAIGSTVGVVGIGAAVVFFARRARLQKIGNGQDAFLQL